MKLTTSSEHRPLGDVPDVDGGVAEADDVARPVCASPPVSTTASAVIASRNSRTSVTPDAEGERSSRSAVPRACRRSRSTRA